MSMDGRCLSGDAALAVFWGKWCGAVTEPHTVPPAQGSHSPTGSIPQPGFMPPRPGASKTALIPTTVSHKTQNSPPEIPHRLLFKQHLSPRLARQRHQNSHPPLPCSPFWRGLMTHANQKIRKYPKGRSPPLHRQATTIHGGSLGSGDGGREEHGAAWLHVAIKLSHRRLPLGRVPAPVCRSGVSPSTSLIPLPCAPTPREPWESGAGPRCPISPLQNRGRREEKGKRALP